MNKKILDFNERLKKSKIAIIGLGVSNIPLLDYLYDLGCAVSIFSDKKIEIDLSKYKYPVYEGEGCLDKLVGFDIIFRSPGCLPTRRELVLEKERGAYITTEVEEVIKNCPCKVIGVTGSDGKTTTTTLIDLVLRANGYKTFLGGNIGFPLFTKISEMHEDDIVVLELSSFQLMGMDVSPSISVITNISPNHLDKHKDFQEYVMAKCNIFNNSDDSVLASDTSTEDVIVEPKKENTPTLINPMEVAMVSSTLNVIGATSEQKSAIAKNAASAVFNNNESNANTGNDETTLKS